MTSNLEIISVEETWDLLTKRFSNWRGLKFKMSWLKTGLSDRLGYNRVRIMEGSAQAKEFFEITKNLELDDLAYLHSRACVNFEQVNAAARISVMINVTWLLAAIVLLNQIFPGEIANLFKLIAKAQWSVELVGLLLSISAFILIPLGVFSYATGGIGMARDLKNLFELSLARRRLNASNTLDGKGAIAALSLKQSLLSDF